MNKNHLIKTTIKLYNLTLLFPKKDPLRFKMRELAADILANSGLIVENSSEQQRLTLDIHNDIDTLNCFFEVVKKLDWVSLDKLLEVQREYIKIKDEVSKALEDKESSLESSDLFNKNLPLQLEETNIQLVEKAPVKKSNSSKSSSSERQQKILEVLREKGKAQVGDFKEIFSDISKRTLRRDFNALMNQDLVERIGERNETFYQLKDRTDSR